MDNFRGFTDTVIPLRDVNFLVGENSTGKTSFLKLMELFSMENFEYFEISPRTSTLFGSFEDHVSIESENRSDFIVGWIDHDNSGNESERAVLSYNIMMFKNREGKPYIFALTYYDSEKVVTLASTQTREKLRTVYYKIDENKKGLNYNEALNYIRDFSVQFRSGNNIYHGMKNLLDMVKFIEGFQEFLLMFEDSIQRSNTTLLLIVRWFVPILTVPDFVGSQTHWFAPIRSKPLRTYEDPIPDPTEEGDHTPFLIRSILGSQKKAQSFMESVKEFGEHSGLFKNVSIQEFRQGRFELQITLTKSPLNLVNVGYGVSQILPIIIEMIRGAKGKLFGVQQPEVHLHPKAQAALGELIYEFATTKKHRYLIETHSEFLLDRFRLALRRSRKRCNAQVIYFERIGGKNVAHPLVIDKKGRYPEGDATKSFREFFLNEAIAKLDI